MCKQVAPKHVFIFMGHWAQNCEGTRGPFKSPRNNKDPILYRAETMVRNFSNRISIRRFLEARSGEDMNSRCGPSEIPALRSIGRSKVEFICIYSSPVHGRLGPSPTHRLQPNATHPRPEFELNSTWLGLEVRSVHPVDLMR